MVEVQSGPDHRVKPGRSLLLRARRDFVATVAVEFLTLASGLLLFHLIAKHESTSGFSYYQVARAVISTLQPVALIGLLIAVQRYLPRAGETTRLLSQRVFLLQIGIVAAFILLGSFLADEVGALLNVSAAGVWPVASMFVGLAGVCLFFLAASILRGCNQVAAANVLWLVGLGVVPVGCYLVVERLDNFLFAQGLMMSAIATVAVLVRGYPAWTEPRPAGVAPTLSTMVGYGMRRVAGDIALPAMLALPTCYVAVVRSGPEAGFVGFATSAVTLVCAAFGLLGPVLLPRISAMGRSAGGASADDRQLSLLPLAAALISALVCAGFFALTPWIVRFYLGAEFMAAVPIVRLAVLAAIPLAVFYAVRPILDAYQDSPITAKLLLVCLALEIVAGYLLGIWLDPARAAALAMTASMATLGASSYIALRLNMHGKRP